MVWNTPVYFDIETTGLSHADEILQIGAIRQDTGETFNQCIMPLSHNYIDPEVTEANGFSIQQGQLIRNGQVMRTTHPKDACKKFIQWLAECDNPPLLIAHNCGSFDAPRIYSLFEQYDCDECFVNMRGEFADTLPLFRNEYPNFPKHSLSYLVAHFLNEKQEHCALEDAHQLMRVCLMAKPQFQVSKLKQFYRVYQGCRHCHYRNGTHLNFCETRRHDDGYFYDDDGDRYDSDGDRVYDYSSSMSYCSSSSDSDY